MKKYLNQLLSDLEAAKTKQPKKMDYKLLYPDHPATDPQYGGVMDYMIEWENAPEWEMDKLFGVKAEAFPPVEQLTEEETETLVVGILELWASFNIVMDLLDDGIPIKLIYKLLVNYWKTETVQYVSEGTLHLESCHYNINTCPWGIEYCSCKEFTDDDLDMTSSNTTSLDITDFDFGEDLPF